MTKSFVISWNVGGRLLIVCRVGTRKKRTIYTHTHFTNKSPSESGKHHQSSMGWLAKKFHRGAEWGLEKKLCKQLNEGLGGEFFGVNKRGKLKLI